MNCAPALVSLCRIVAAVSLVSLGACAAKHESRPPILTECGSNDQSCSGNGTGASAGGATGNDAAPADDASGKDTGAPDTSLPADAGLAFDSGLGLTD